MALKGKAEVDMKGSRTAPVVAYNLRAVPSVGLDNDMRVTEVTFHASCPTYPSKQWTATLALLSNHLSSLIGKRRTAALIGDLSLGESVLLPGTYSAHDLVEFGFRIMPSNRGALRDAQDQLKTSQG